MIFDGRKPLLKLKTMLHRYVSTGPEVPATSGAAPRRDSAILRVTDTIPSCATSGAVQPAGQAAPQRAFIDHPLGLDPPSARLPQKRPRDPEGVSAALLREVTSQIPATSLQAFITPVLRRCGTLEEAHGNWL